MDIDVAMELVSVLIDIRDELKTQNERLEKIELAIDRIYGGMPWTLLENLQEMNQWKYLAK